VHSLVAVCVLKVVYCAFQVVVRAGGAFLHGCISAARLGIVRDCMRHVGSGGAVQWCILWGGAII
jgi:hypothetical protein